MESKILGCNGRIQDVEKTMGITEKFAEDHNVSIQLMDPEMIYGEKHIMSAVEHAVRAFKDKRNTSNSLAMEILLYASGKTQVKEAIKFMGLKKGGSALLVCVGKTSLENAKGPIPKNIEGLVAQLDLHVDNSLLEGKKATLKKFGITNAEIETVDKSMYQDLILERVALVDVMK